MDDLRRNVRFDGDDPPRLRGEWVAIPREDFDRVRAALDGLREDIGALERRNESLTDQLVVAQNRRLALVEALRQADAFLAGLENGSEHEAFRRTIANWRAAWAPALRAAVLTAKGVV